jgi:hypothetical protein
MKALWLRYTITFILGLSQRAIAFVMIFGTTWMRLMGLNSVMDSAQSLFFGNNTMLAVLMILKLDADNSEKALMTLMRSSLVISQQERTKAMEKSSGPGALSAGMSSTASLISSSEKGNPRSSRGCVVGVKSSPVKIQLAGRRPSKRLGEVRKDELILIFMSRSPTIVVL